MFRKNLLLRRKTLAALVLCVFPLLAWSGAPYEWQIPQANVTPQGDIEWTPQPFEMKVGEVVRYIDYENGDDANSGESKDAAWKHHPWDRFATGNAAAHEGVTTYIFKRGSIYRGELVADESGEPGNPIILTASAEDRGSPYYWGEGYPMLFGSTRLPAQWVPATQVNHPERLPEPQNVWAIDLTALNLTASGGDGEGMIKIRNAAIHYKDENAVGLPWIGLHLLAPDGRSEMQHLARTPNWQQGNPNFAIDYWHSMDGGIFPQDEEGKRIEKGIVDEWLKGHPEDYFVGGYIWPQYGHFMGGAMPRRINETFTGKNKKEYPQYDPEQGVIYEGAYGTWHERLRYMIDNLPQFLDAPGEFYHDRNTGTLFYRPEPGVNPNQLDFELTHFSTGITITNQSNVDVRGLLMRYYNDNGIFLGNEVENILIKNNIFEDILDKAISHGFDNWRVNADPEYANNIFIHDNYFQDIWTTAIAFNATPDKDKIIDHIEVMRNKTFNTGIRHKDNVQTPLAAIELKFMKTSIVAGNVTEDSWGSGIMLFSGTHGQGSGSQAEIPLNRHLVFHNKTLDTALAVNDYGGMSLWMGGPIYCFNNNIGNSPGVMPAGITMFGGSDKPKTLSYPLYLDGAYKVYSFNNIIWARSNDRKNDPFATGTPGYFMVFGFLNQFTNNTLYRTGEGVGGSGGHRNDVISNLMASVGGGDRRDSFIAHDREGDPSLVGGGDDGTSGRRGVPTLAYAHNVMHGTARAGQLIRGGQTNQNVQAEEVEELAAMMQAFPIRFGELGWRAESKPIIGKADDQPVIEGSDADFRPGEGSFAIDKGATYYIPYNLYGTLGEWHFTENRAEPNRQIDYAYYQSNAHYHRMYYEFVPGVDLVFNDLTLDGYSESPLEDWAKGSVVFDGQRYAKVTDADMRKDITIPVYTTNRRGDRELLREWPEKDWILPEPTEARMRGDNINYRRSKFADDAVIRYPGELRHTPRVTDENVLVEAVFEAERGLTNAGLMGKYDGRNGYRLIINGSGQAEFQLAHNGRVASVTSDSKVNDGGYYHVLAEADRESGRLTIYVNGEEAGSATGAPSPNQSLDNNADFLVGKTHDDQFFKGKIDTMRVAEGTLEQSQTSIEEVWAWFTEGPWRYDMLGNKSVDRRDAGAIEKVR